jgi:hypothetical protein
MVDCGCDTPSPNPVDGEVNHYALLCLECRLVVVQFGQMGIEGRSLASPLYCPTLGVDLSSVGSHLLLLLVGMLLLKREPGVWLRYDSL